MKELKNLKDIKQFEDMDIVSLDDLDALDEEESSGRRRLSFPLIRSGKKKPIKKWKTWQKIFSGVCVTVSAFLIISGSVFFMLRSKGEENLKTQVKEPVLEEDEEVREPGHYVYHNGKEYRYREDVINILCLGIDKKTGMEEEREGGTLGLADAILLISIDTERDALKIIAVPRDTMTQVQMTTEEGEVVETRNLQLTMQYAYGRTAAQSCELMVDTVSDLMYLVPIQRYCAINMQALPVINDAVGGVDVTVLEDMTWHAPEFVYGNTVHLQGQRALDYVQQRNELVTGSNMSRIERQKQYISAFIEKAKSMVTQDPSIPVTLFQQLTSNMTTNIQVEDIAYLVPELLNMSISPEQMQMIPGEVVPGEKLEEYHVDAEALKNLVIECFYEEVEDTKSDAARKTETDAAEGTEAGEETDAAPPSEQ